MRAEQIELKQKFSKGFAKNIGIQNIPVQYASYIRNLRIRDLGIAPRLGVYTVYDGASWGTTYGLHWDDKNGRLFRHYEDKWEEINPDTGELTDRGWAVALPKVETFIFQHGIYIIICTGTTAPYVFNTTTNTLALSTAIDAGVYPTYWEIFNGYTFLAAWNKLYSSRPVTAAHPEYAIEWATSNTDCRQIIFDVDITWLRSTMEKLWICTNKNWEYIDANTITTVGSTINLFSQKFAQDQRIVAADSVVSVGTKLFYWTKWNKIRAIGYTQWVAQLQIADVSDVPAVGIDWFMQYDLASDQSWCKGIFDDERNLIKWHVKSKYSLVNDLVVIYDVINNAFLCDDNKLFSKVTKIGKRIFAAAGTKVNRLYEDERWVTDYGREIVCVYETPDMKQWQANLKKFYRWSELGGRINGWVKIEAESFVDGRQAMKKMTVEAGGTWQYSEVGIAWTPIAWEALAGTMEWQLDSVVDRWKVITQSQVRLKWKSNRRRFTFSGKRMDFVIDYMALFILPTKKYRASDKF